MVIELEIIPILQSISYIAGATGVCIAAIYYVVNLRNSQKTMQLTLESRQAQLFMQLYSTFCSDYIQKARNEVSKWSYRNYDDFQSKYSYDVNPETYQLHSSLSFFFEGIGVLVSRKLIDPSLVDDLMSGPIITYWEKMRPYYLEYRARFDWPQFGEYIEHLYNHIKPIAEKQKTELRKAPSLK
jgi:hypothetical protein